MIYCVINFRKLKAQIVKNHAYCLWIVRESRPSTNISNVYLMDSFIICLTLPLLEACWGKKKKKHAGSFSFVNNDSAKLLGAVLDCSDFSFPTS